MARQYKMLTYNTHLFEGTAPEMRPGMVYADKLRRNRIIQLVENISADVVGLCEVWGDDYKQVFQKELKSAYPYSDIHETHFWHMGPGLCIFSKHKITDVSFVEYDKSADWDGKAGKGVLGLVIEPAGESPLRVFFTHTQSGDYPEIRTTQFQQISKLMGKFHPEISRRTLVAGDLNVSAEISQPKKPSPEYHQMLGFFGGFKDAVPTCEPQYTSDGLKNCLKNYFSKGDESRARLDYVLLSENFVFKEAKVLNDSLWSGDNDHPCKDCSDHYPLMVSFEC